MYSLIFQGFSGRNDNRGEAFQLAFGERGCYMSLASNSEEHAPCELSANLTIEDAGKKAAILREAGMTVEIVLTAEVSGVKHRASECWPTHRASNGESFTEREDIVVRGSSLDLRERMKKWHRTPPGISPWVFELEYNHEHTTNTLNRRGLRMARERGAEIGAALTECFPDRWFLLVYRVEQVSFCQFTEELPLGVSPGDRRVVDLRVKSSDVHVCFCEGCERSTPYVERSRPDIEFPHARFADCAVCGNGVILWSDQEVVLASDAARRSFPTPEVPIDAWEHGADPVRLPSSFEELKAAVQDRLHPTLAWRQAAIRLWLGRELSELKIDEPMFAQTLLQIEELSALLLAYRIRQLALPPEDQDRTALTPERLGISRSSPLYHPARRVLSPVTVVTRISGTTTIHALFNGTDESYHAGRRLAPERPFYESEFGYGILDSQGRTFWHTGHDGKQYRVANDIAPHGAKPWTCRVYGAAKRLDYVREQGTERCVAYTFLRDGQKRVFAQHRRLFRRFHELDIEPDPVITTSLSDGFLTLRSDVFVWGVFLAWHGADKLSDNAFDLLPGIPYSIPWDEAICGRPKIWRTGNSLFMSAMIGDADLPAHGEDDAS